MTRREQSAFAEDTQEAKLPIYKNADGDKIVLTPGTKVPSTVKKVAGRRKTKSRSKKRSLLKTRKVR